MISNRSVPVDTVLPHLVYSDVAAAIAWLTQAFGLVEHYRYAGGDSISGAQMHLGKACLMLHRGTPTPISSVQMTVFVDDVDAHFLRVKSANATIVEGLHETVYGERQYGAEDLAGHRWLFSQHARNVHPEEWGATVSRPLITATQVSPMLAVSDGNAAIDFYTAAFGATVLWHLEHDGHVVAGLEVQGAPFFLAQESPEYGTCAPSASGFTTVRIELFVEDPAAIHKQALLVGAVERSPVVEHAYAMNGPQPINRMLQGAVVDPFGHMWLIGKIL